MSIFGKLFGSEKPAPSNADAQYNLDKGFSYILDQKYTKAMKWYKRAAAQGNTDAQYFIGDMYYEGQGVRQNYAEAFKWFKLAAAQGQADAQYYIGFMYDMGEGVAQDDAEAFKWYKLAAANGNRSAQYIIGHMYYEGQGVAQDYTEALKWLKLAARQGNGGALYDIGLMYRMGQGVAQDDVRAYMWLNLAAVRRYANADTARDILAAQMTPQQISEAPNIARNVELATLSIVIENNKALGSDFEDGVWAYLQNNYAVAIVKFRLAAVQGHAIAQSLIGSMYDNGQGVVQDYAEGLKWYKLAAAQGNAAASCNIGLKYWKGKGDVQDYTEALKWLKLAAAQGHRDAQHFFDMAHGDMMRAMGQGG